MGYPGPAGKGDDGEPRNNTVLQVTTPASGRPVFSKPSDTYGFPPSQPMKGGSQGSSSVVWDDGQYPKPWSFDSRDRSSYGRGRQILGPPPPSLRLYGDGDHGDGPEDMDHGPKYEPGRYGGSSHYDGPGSEGSKATSVPDPKDDTLYRLSIALPIVVLVILLFIVFKTWPKTLISTKKVLRWLGILSGPENSDFMPNGSAYFKKILPNTFYQAQAQLDKITVGSANVELSDTVLGRGEYGLVTKGFATGLLGYAPRTVVAVKTLIRPTDPKQRACFLKEIETMMTIGRHLNIVNLLGTVVEGNPMLILEYCENGSLKRFLKKQRSELFYNHVFPDGNLMPYDEMEHKKKQTLMDQRTSAIYGITPNDQICNQQVLSTRDLITLSYQTVRGLEYLSTHSIVHRDIAARNVLVTDKCIAKLSDFGMAVQWTSETSVKEKDFDYPMPIKWMAPESILRKTFSQKSDVWAFGILLHEVFGLGGDPYPDFTVQGQVMPFIAKIIDGFRMPRPLYFPSELYTKLETKCLEIDPAARPTFTEIRQMLEEFIPLVRQEEYLEMSQEYEAFNEMFGTLTNNAYVDLNYESINYKKVKL